MVEGADELWRLLQPSVAGPVRPAADAPAAPTSEPALFECDGWHVYATPLDPLSSGRGRVLAEFTVGERRLPLLEQDDGTIVAPFDLGDAYAAYVSERWSRSSTQRRLSARQLALFYRAKRLIPRAAQLRARRALIRWQGTPTFPAWPLDDGVSRLVELYASCLLRSSGADELAFRWFWPGGYDAAMVLTHDVESQEGIRLAVELADLEEEQGFRSAFNFGAWYDPDPGILRELTDRGFEIGMHGLVHDRSLFSSRAEFERQLPLLRELADRLGAVGFRSPATHRVFEWLGELPIEYDGTIPHSDPYEPIPGGCCSLWPYFVGAVVELPYTLPQDHTLLTLLGHRSPSLWLATAREIEARNGLIHAVSHPDPGYLADPARRQVYREFLAGMAERPRVWCALPRDVARWWRRRDSASGADTELVIGSIRAGSSPWTAALRPTPTSG